MYRELHQYLILHKQLHLPGIGTFCIEKKPADFNIADKLIHPAAFTVALLPGQNTPSKTFFRWLGSKMGTTERDAVIHFNDFLFDLRKQLSAGNKLEWSGVGTLSKATTGDILLEPALKDHAPGSPISTNKVLRHDAQHLIRVGEDQKTSAQMRELLSPADDEKKSWWWTVALILVVLSVIFIGYYFSVNGLNASSASNQQKLVPKKETKTHY